MHSMINDKFPCTEYRLHVSTESEFNEIESLLKSAKNRFKLRAGLNLATLNKVLSGTKYC